MTWRSRSLVAEDRQQVDRAPVQRALLVQAGEQEQVLHHQQPHPRRLVLDAAQQPVELAGLAGRPLPVQLREAPDGGQRGAQLVARVGDEASHPLRRLAHAHILPGSNALRPPSSAPRLGSASGFPGSS
jgi:hypothetical protein